MTLLAYRYALDPTPAQERALRSHAGAARVAFNWGLARVKAVMGQREAERSYGIAEADLTPAVSWSLYSLRKDWNAAKDTVAPWWRECSKEAFNTGLDQLARGLKNWGGSRNGKRKGKAAGFPRFRSKRKARLSVRFTTGAVCCEVTHAVLPRLGRIKLHERAATGDARILSATVRHERGRWLVSFTAEQDISRPAPRLPGAVAGVDAGIKALAVLSTGEEVPNPRHMSHALRKVRRLSRTASRRQGPDRRAGRKPSNRWRRADAARNKALGKVADQRRDGLHKLTTRLAAEFGTVVIEDLNVAGMVKSRRLARHVADASFGEFRRQLEYKTAWHGGRLIVADRWFASSRTCSGCGAVKAKLLLSERTYVCTSCGLVADRDLNAALNLAEYGNRLVAGSGPETENGRGADRKTTPGSRVAVKRQPGTATAGQTGTAAPQDGCGMSALSGAQPQRLTILATVGRWPAAGRRPAPSAACPAAAGAGAASVPASRSGTVDCPAGDPRSGPAVLGAPHVAPGKSGPAHQPDRGQACRARLSTGRNPPTCRRGGSRRGGGRRA